MPDIVKAWDVARSYQNRGFYNPTYKTPALKKKNYLTKQKKSVYVLTGTLASRETSKTADGKPCILFTMHIPDFQKPVVVTVCASGMNMISIIRTKIGSELSIVRHFKNDDRTSYMTRIATEEDMPHDTSGLWIVRPDLGHDLHQTIVAMQRARTPLRIRNLMSSNMCEVMKPNGSTQTILRSLLTRP